MSRARALQALATGGAWQRVGTRWWRHPVCGELFRSLEGAGVPARRAGVSAYVMSGPRGGWWTYPSLRDAVLDARGPWPPPPHGAGRAVAGSSTRPARHPEDVAADYSQDWNRFMAERAP